MMVSFTLTLESFSISRTQGAYPCTQAKLKGVHPFSTAVRIINPETETNTVSRKSGRKTQGKKKKKDEEKAAAAAATATAGAIHEEREGVIS